jgi:glycosyltransferase involved in cell wall biosynthesis
MTAPFFTVATISYQSGRWVGQTIESVLASTFDDFEFLISDDCSPDDSWDVIQQRRDPRIRAWRNRTNLGEYQNRNKVLQEAKGRFILFVDGDDLLYKDALTQYAEVLRAFPRAKGVWAAYAIDFAVLPYEFTAYELTALNYLGFHPVAEVGFTESVFEVDALRNLGGFDERFMVGDRYVKRRFMARNPVVIVHPGRAFWRQHPDQASKRVTQGYRNFVESKQIDEEILASPDCPLQGAELETAKRNLRIFWAKRLVRNTLRTGKLLEFFRLRKALKIPFSDLHLAFQQADYRFKAGGTPTEPLISDFHFPQQGRPLVGSVVPTPTEGGAPSGL